MWDHVRKIARLMTPGGRPAHSVQDRNQVTKAEIQALFAEEFAQANGKVSPRQDRPAPEERLFYLREEALKRARRLRGSKHTPAYGVGSSALRSV